MDSRTNGPHYGIVALLLASSLSFASCSRQTIFEIPGPPLPAMHPFPPKMGSQLFLIDDLLSAYHSQLSYNPIYWFHDKQRTTKTSKHFHLSSSAAATSQQEPGTLSQHQASSTDNGAPSQSSPMAQNILIQDGSRCPEGPDTFFCSDCGGIQGGSPAFPYDGIPNGRCTGVSCFPSLLRSRV